MTYEALARGANGLFYFTSDWRASGHPETWAALTSIVQEVRVRLPLFQAQPQWWPKQHAFGDRSLRFNAALQSSITTALLRVDNGTAAVAGGAYVLAVNNTTNRHTYWFTLPPRNAADRSRAPRSGPNETTGPGSFAPAEIPVLGEDRRLRPVENWLKDEFEPYAVHVYGPLEL